MKLARFEKFAIVVIVLYLLVSVSAPLSNFLMATLFPSKEYATIHTAGQIFMLLRFIVLSPVELAVAVWLFLEAKRSGKAKWVWCLFGITFGLVAAVFYILLDIRTVLYNHQDNAANKSQEGIGEELAKPSE